MTEMNTENKLEAMQRANGPLLEVKNLQVDFTTDDGRWSIQDKHGFLLGIHHLIECLLGIQ